MSRLEVDWSRCDGHGLCAAAAPSAIQLDPWGFPLPTEPPVGSDRRRRAWTSEARRAASVCPALALRLEGASRR